MVVKNIKEFTCTSTQPYDRHHYELIYMDKTKRVFDDYEQLRYYWMQWASTHTLNYVNVIDLKPLRTSHSKGFA